MAIVKVTLGNLLKLYSNSSDIYLCHTIIKGPVQEEVFAEKGIDVSDTISLFNAVLEHTTVALFECLDLFLRTKQVCVQDIPVSGSTTLISRYVTVRDGGYHIKLVSGETLDLNDSFHGGDRGRTLRTDLLAKILARYPEAESTTIKIPMDEIQWIIDRLKKR